jgi:hypothetical protein
MQAAWSQPVAEVVVFPALAVDDQGRLRSIDLTLSEP